MAVYSHSRLETYENCPLRYKLIYLDRIEREQEGIEGFLGTTVHETLQKCYNDVKVTRVCTLEEVLAFFRSRWQRNWHEGIVITKDGATPEHYRALGEKMVTNYYRRHAPFDADTTVATELRLTFPLSPDGTQQVQGLVDRLALAKDGAWEIHDYKTSSRLPPQKEVDANRQLAFYHLGVQNRWPQAKDIRLIWHYLAFDVDMVSQRTPQDLSALVEKTRELIDQIESATAFPPGESGLCDWCEFPDLCPRRKHEAKVEQMPVNEFLKEPGVDLVNRFAALKEVETSLEEEMEKVKEAILLYAEREGVDAIRGSGHRVKIVATEKWKFPSKSDPERPRLDGLLRQSGKWDEVSALDSAALNTVITDGSWTRDLIERVLEFGCLECTRYPRLTKLKERE